MVQAYEVGIDDYLIKPVSPSRLQAKIKVWLRRSASISIDVLNSLKVGTLQLFPSEKTILVENRGAVRLTNLELRLPYYLMNRPGQIVTIEELNQRVWGYNAEADNTMPRTWCTAYGERSKTTQPICLSFRRLREWVISWRVNSPILQ